MVKYEYKINPKKCFKALHEGDIVIQDYKSKKAIGDLSYVTGNSSAGKCIFSAKPLQGNPLRIGESARESQFNKIYFRKAKKSDIETVRKRFSF